MGWGRWRVEIQREGVRFGAAAGDLEGGVVCGDGGSRERERVRALGFGAWGESGVVCGGWVRP